MCYQCCVAGDEQRCSTEALGNKTLLAEVTVPSHHHDSFALYHIWRDSWDVTQRSGGQIQQRVHRLETKQNV